MLKISKVLLFSTTLALAACGGGQDDSKQSSKTRVLLGDANVRTQAVALPSEQSASLAQNVTSQAVSQQLASLAQNVPTQAVVLPSEQSISPAEPTRSEIEAAMAKTGLQFTQNSIERIKPIVEKLPPNSSAPRVRQGDFSGSGSGWIDDSSSFWNHYNLVFTGGGGSYTYARPTPVPAPPPVVPALTGLASYAIPATRSGVWFPVPWVTFLDTSMACNPWCSMISADVDPITWRQNPPAWSLGGDGVRYANMTLGSADLDMLWMNLKRPAVFAALAVALDKKNERLTKAWEQLDALEKRSSIMNSKEEFQYALFAKVDGGYPDVRLGYVQLKVGDVWKFGTSLDPDGRYSPRVLDALNLSMVIQTRGNPLQVLVQEKINLIGYYIHYGELPPGNKIFK